MTAAAPTFTQIRAQVAAIRKHDPAARVFGIEASGRWTGPEVQRYGDETYRIVQCGSPLAMRVALQEDRPEVTAKVLLTDLPEEQIGNDILVRVARRKFRPIRNWQIVKDLFQARYIDPRIAEHGRLAELLLDSVPLEGYPPVRSGVLDAETVWGILLEQQLGLAVARPDLIGLLKWTMEADNVDRLRRADEAFHRAAAEWIEQYAGSATGAVLSCVEANQRPDALPVGLALGVIFSKEAAGELDKAAGRIEKYVGDAKLSEPIAERWASAADEIVRLRVPDARARASWLQRADEILETVEGDSHAYLSCTSPRGFSQRLARYGRILSSVVDTDATVVPEQVDEALRYVAEHAQAEWGLGPGRLVVMLSDHGHVLDRHSQYRQGDGGDRWRKDDGAPAEDEVRIAGERVVLPADHRLIAPWSENPRYSAKKNGYHDGVTMQEMIVPVAVLSARDDLPEGWAEPPVDTPDWWFAPLEGQVPVEEHVVQTPKPPRKKPAGMLFDLAEVGEPAAAAEEPVPSAPAAKSAPAWLDRLLQSPILGEQKKLGGRTLPSDEVLRRLLEALTEQGGKMTSAALAHRMQWPPFRLRGLLATVQRVLNVEGYPILTRDETSDTVELNQPLLCRQFEIGQDPR